MQDREAQCRAWPPYVRLIQGLFGLRDWTIDISEVKPAAAHVATIAPVPGKRYATLELSDDFLASTPEDQRYTILHELLHCHVAHPDCIAGKELTPDVYRQFCLAIEYAVDAIATAAAPHFPLPEPRNDEATAG